MPVINLRTGKQKYNGQIMHQTKTNVEDWFLCLLSLSLSLSFFLSLFICVFRIVMSANKKNKSAFSPIFFHPQCLPTSEDQFRRIQGMAYGFHYLYYLTYLSFSLPGNTKTLCGLHLHVVVSYMRGWKPSPRRTTTKSYC
jgi:hypothetical protein